MISITFTTAAAALAALPLFASAAPAMTKRGGYRATYYDTSVGLGACGNYNAPDTFTVALNSQQFGDSYPSAVCGDSIWISYNGKTTNAIIQDSCPSCPYLGLDLSQSLFEFFASTDVGVIYLDWGFNGGAQGAASATTTSAYVAPTPTPTSTYVAPAPTTTSSTEEATPATSTSSAAAAASATETSVSGAETCPTDEFILYDANNVTIYDQTFFIKDDKVRLTNWASRENLVNLLANSTRYCLNGTADAWDSTSNSASLLSFFDF